MVDEKEKSPYSLWWRSSMFLSFSAMMVSVAIYNSLKPTINKALQFIANTTTLMTPHVVVIATIFCIYPRAAMVIVGPGDEIAILSIIVIWRFGRGFLARRR